MWWFSRSAVSDSCDPMDWSLPDFSVHGILQARTLEQPAISFSRGDIHMHRHVELTCGIMEAEQHQSAIS